MTKRIVLLFLTFMAGSILSVAAQCSLCTKTAQQLGEKPAEGLNSGIIYLMAVPFALVGVIGFRWWKNNQTEDSN